ncbi:MAG TPA: cytochrome C oxidase subunit IV family protein [Gemmatimonadaceae bacterium]|jgi:cytochrome c oxidase subunit 4|nr:cytochrome C oxidase subunit IV family protein [Gemmatimonadaceae bacterium]
MPDHHDTFTHTNPEIDVHSMGEVHEHPTWKQYKWVAIILTVITVLEVWAYYIPSFVASAAFVPILLIMSALKFAIVVAFYMHLKYDHKLFRALFTGPLIIAMATLISLLFLFGKFVGR